VFVQPQPIHSMIDGLVAGRSFLPLRLSRNRIPVVIPPLSPVDYANRSLLKYRTAVYVQEYFQGNTFMAASALSLEASEFPAERIGGALSYRGALIEIQSLLDGLLTPSLPLVDSGRITVCDGLTRQYYTQRQQLDPAGTVVGQFNDQSSWVIRAGVAPEQYADYRDTLFTDTAALGGHFLTYQPDDKRVLPDQPEYLCWLNNVQPAPKSIRLRLQTIGLDGTTETRTVMSLASLAPMTVYCLPVGPLALDLSDQVHAYQVWVSNENDEGLSVVRSYWIDRRYYRQCRYLLFGNSLGGWDTLALTGRATEKLSTTRLISERPPHPDGLASYAERTVSNVTGERELSVSTAYLSKTERSWLRELSFAEQVYLLADDWLPLLLADNDYLADSDEETLIGRTFVFRYANPASQYSPLPPAPPRPERPQGWRPYRTACELNDFGIRTGRKVATMLERYYLDDNTPVFPAQIRTNLPGEEGYLAPQVSADCQTTPYRSVAISRVGTYQRNNCGSDQEGTTALISVAAGAFGSELSQLDADAKAEAAWQRLNTQEYANQNGSCVVSSEQYAYAVADGMIHYRANKPGQFDISFVPFTTVNSPLWGNCWSLQGTAGPYVYPIWSNDLDFPVRTDGWWFLRAYGPVGSRQRVRRYRNGVLVYDQTLTMNLDGYELTTLYPDGSATAVQSKDRWYVAIEAI
jgi:hypothetical protein